jgi:hypothetical protein
MLSSLYVTWIKPEVTAPVVRGHGLRPWYARIASTLITISHVVGSCVGLVVERLPKAKISDLVGRLVGAPGCASQSHDHAARS